MLANMWWLSIEIFLHILKYFANGTLRLLVIYTKIYYSVRSITSLFFGHVYLDEFWLEIFEVCYFYAKMILLKLECYRSIINLCVMLIKDGRVCDL